MKLDKTIADTYTLPACVCVPTYQLISSYLGLFFSTTGFWINNNYKKKVNETLEVELELETLLSFVSVESYMKGIKIKTFLHQKQKAFPKSVVKLSVERSAEEIIIIIIRNSFNTTLKAIKIYNSENTKP